MIYGELAIRESGMPLPHGAAFSQVAKEENCIIISRSVGKYATELISEGYASKGFHVKAKSCNWGPMAGFVLADPRFSKKGRAGIASQKKEVEKAIGLGARLTPLYISEERRRSLPLLFRNDETTTYKEQKLLDNEYKIVVTKDGLIMEFVLKRMLPSKFPNSHGCARVWAVCYRYSYQLPESKFIDPRHRISCKYGVFYQVMGLTDPLTNNKTFKAIMTGDYDLWGCFPLVSNHDPRTIDRRKVTGSNSKIFGFSTYARKEFRHMGNMTPRLMNIRVKLNAKIRSSGYTGGNMVHHGDEAGRPMVENIEVDSVAFFPNGDVLYFSSVPEYKSFIEISRNMGYQTILNPWWHVYADADKERMNDIIQNRNAHISVLDAVRELKKSL